MKNTVNVLVVGVGGQGILRLSDIMAAVAFRAGFDVKKSEIHGLSQRGGAVNGHIRWGERIFTPVIPDGEAHFLLALEELEALRWAHRLRPDGLAIVNDHRILPAPVVLGQAAYPADLTARIASYARGVRVAATGIARELGNPRAANSVLLGVLSRFLDFAGDCWDETFQAFFPAGLLEMNRQAFAAGRDARIEAVARIEPVADDLRA